jgi:phage terminase large subunit-like protein
MSDADADARELLELLEAVDKRKTYDALSVFEPYEKQKQFFALGATRRERLLTAGNQQGKTMAGAAEMAYHLTGRYPFWWRGRKWDRPIRAFICGETSITLMENCQRKLCGEPGVESAWGSGLIPKECLIDRTLGRGVQHGYDRIKVRHKSGGISVAAFKSYEQGRQKFQGETIDCIWNDEEAPFEIYVEELARTHATAGMIYTTFTSMMGETKLVARFFKEESPDRAVVSMGLKDALHISRDEYDRIIAGIPAYQRVARIHGGILRGIGRIFDTPEEALVESPITYIPTYWRKIWGIDPGISHPFGAVMILWDQDNDVVHIHHTIRVADQTPLQHAFAMKKIGIEVPVAWPKDALNREMASGTTLATQYKQHGLQMLGIHAQWPDGGISTEAGISEMDERMKTGRLKVAGQLSDWFSEYRNYHRGEDFKIKKTEDDLLSATRVAIMMKRFAKAVQLGDKVASRWAEGDSGGIAKNVDYPLFE